MEQNKKLDSQKSKVTQEKVGVSFKFAAGESFVKTVEAGITYSKSDNTDFNDTYIILNQAQVFDQSKVRNTFVGAKEVSAKLSGTFDIGTHGELVPTIGVTNTNYNDGSSWRFFNTSNANLIPNRWYYIVYTRNSSHHSIYINGVRKSIN